MTALLVIDMQRGAFDAPDSRHDRKGVVQRINRLARALREAGGTVVFIQQENPKGDLFEAETQGWELLPEVTKTLEANPRAWQFFEQLAPSYRRAYVGWIHSAKRVETREKRLREAVSLLAAGEKLGLK